MSEALIGIRVLETGGRATALAGRILADLGAEVILVEPPEGGEIRRRLPAIERDVGAEERGFAHLYFNANKRSVVLDVGSEAGMATFLGLAATADVLLDASLPGWWRGVGLDHAALRRVNDTLVQCSITPFGQDTPWRDRKANDLVAGAAGGLIQVSGSPTGTPMQGGSHPSYTMAGLVAASAISMALHQRDMASQPTKHGVHIDVSMQEATALTVMQTATPGTWRWQHRIPRRPGLSIAMPCKDGKFVSLLVRPDRFSGFLLWADKVGIDHGMSPDDWTWARLDAPREGNPVSETTLELAARLTRDEFVDGALEADIICLPVLDFPDLEKTEQYRVNDQFLAVDNDILGARLGFVRSPVDAMADGIEIARAPGLGEHQPLADAIKPVARPAGGGGAIQPDPAQALSGLRIVDFGWVLAAPIGTRILASFGAEVIRVESSKKPDSMRSQAGPDGKPDADMGGLYNSVNAGKKSLTVDLTKPEGLALVKTLIAESDVVVNNFRPFAMERMGLGYDVLREIKPDIILLNLPGAHRHGPWGQRPSMGNILMAASGFNMLTGFPDDRPRGIGVAYPDFTSPHLLVTVIMAALRQRAKTGAGQELHLTQLSGVLSLLGAEWMQYKATGVQPPRNANRDPNYCPHGIYPARQEMDPDMDAWVAVAVEGDGEWQALCNLMGRPDLSVDSRFVSHELRKRNEDALDELIRAWTRDQDKWLLAERLQEAGIAAAPVENLKDMMDLDPQLVSHYQIVRQPAAPDVDIPIDVEAARWVGQSHILQRAPMLGEHNQYVVQEILGRSDEEFAHLIANDILV